MEKLKKTFDTKIKKIILFMILDLCCLMISSLLAIVLRFDFVSIPKVYIYNIYLLFIIDAIIAITMY